MPKTLVKFTLSSLPPVRGPLIRNEISKRWAVLQGRPKLRGGIQTLLAGCLLHPTQNLFNMKAEGMCSQLPIKGNQYKPALPNQKKKKRKLSLFNIFFPRLLVLCQQHTAFILQGFIGC